MIPPDARPRPSPGFLPDPDEGELLLYDPDTRRVAYCNASAALD